jgi:hypothetical protein
MRGVGYGMRQSVTDVRGLKWNCLVKTEVSVEERVQQESNNLECIDGLKLLHLATYDALSPEEQSP